MPWQKVAVLAVAVLAVVLLAAIPVAQADSRLDQFRREYPGHAQRVEAFYQSLTIQAHETFTGEPGSPANFADLTFWGDGDRLGIEVLYQSTMEGASYWFKGGRAIGCAAPSCSFSIASEPDGTLVVKAQRRDKAGYKAARERVLYKARFATAPYSLADARATEIFSDKVVQLLGISDETQDGQNVVKVSWRAAIEEADRGGWFTFLPDGGWVLTGYEITHRRHDSKYPIPSKQCGRVEYRRESGFELPLVKSVRHWSESAGDGGKESNVSQFDVTSVTHGVSDPAVFELSHYDLEPAARKGRSVYFWLITVLLVSMAGAIGFRYLASRARRA